MDMDINIIKDTDNIENEADRGYYNDNKDNINSQEEQIQNISWKLIDKMFTDNPQHLVAHHLDSYNEFFEKGIYRIFRENNPIRFKETVETTDKRQTEVYANECSLYLGGKEGNKIYYGKPIIYDDEKTHYMYPNDARLRNMTYGITIHYDVDIDMVYYEEGDNGKKERRQYSTTIEQVYLGKFPIMLQSNLCILNSLDKEVRYNMGECRSDYGGYFIIDGKEKVILSQEKFADNMLYIRENKADNEFSHSAEIRSVSEDASKPIRTTSVKVVAPSARYTNKQIVVAIPNVRKPIPLFIVMRALGVLSDKDIIKTCLLDLEKNSSMMELFIPSIHDANRIFNQASAIKFIATFTKSKTIFSAYEILSDYFLPHIGEMNFLDKAYFLGYMVNRLLNVYTKQEQPTDRDNFRFKRVELSGTLIYDLFREYYLLQKKMFARVIDEIYFYGKIDYIGANFTTLIENNVDRIFKEDERKETRRIVELGFRKAFKGNWGSQENTKRVGVVQDLNRLSWNSFISHMRKMNLELPATSKVVGPRHLHSSQWGYIDPVDSPDGANIGLHKHLSISTYVTSRASGLPIISWIRGNYTNFKNLSDYDATVFARDTKVFVNGNWIGVIDNPLEVVENMKLYRRNAIIPIFTSISFDYNRNEIQIYTDAGRLTRPLYYIENGGLTTNSRENIHKNKKSFERSNVIEKLKTGTINWEQIVSGFGKKNDERFSIKENKLYSPYELYGIGKKKQNNNDGEDNVEDDLSDEDKKMLSLNKALVDYLDTAEEERAYIAMKESDIRTNTYGKYFTHLEIEASLLFGVMGNQVIFPQNNQFPRNVFSCGQSKQAVSLYHTNYQMRMDKMGVVLNYGQTPLIKSRYIEYVNQEQNPYGVNAIVAIMSYTGFNVEDSILVNEGSLARGIFRTTYFTTYEDREESSKIAGNPSSKFGNIQKHNVVGMKKAYDYSQLDDSGLIRENTQIDEKVILIGKMIQNPERPDVFVDASTTTKKGQLGFVDKAFITDGEEGFNIAKVRVREERIPAIGDKMASRAGQKGTLGLIIPEENMPFTADGIRPDLIINPHAIPSRMTIGQLVESLFGKLCANYGGYGDATAFQSSGVPHDIYGKMLVNAGFHSTGNDILCNGMTGEQIQADIFIGPTYYMRLKHMVKDKINYRARGPRNVLTRQTVQGRANDGGLRVGEMERDGILAHGASYFLNESFMVRGDEYYMAVCNKTGAISIYNKPKNMFFSPFADGPIRFHTQPDGGLQVMNVTRFGRSFSILRIPYSLKLLIQELQVLNVQMRIVTDENVDQLLNMSYSNNISRILNLDDSSNSSTNQNKELNNTAQIEKAVTEYASKITKRMNESQVKANNKAVKEVVENNETPELNIEQVEFQQHKNQEEQNRILSEESVENIENVEPEYAPWSPAYVPEEQLGLQGQQGESPVFNSFSTPGQSPMTINIINTPPVVPVSQEQIRPVVENQVNKESDVENIIEKERKEINKEKEQAIQNILEIEDINDNEHLQEGGGSSKETEKDKKEANSGDRKKIVI
jgi:DNA-directed RNA polymerase II subunit RPB2